MNTTYGSRFYDDQAAGSRRSSQRIVPVVLELAKPCSVVDVGCGVGTWLSSYAEMGVTEYLGLDGAWVDPKRLLIPAERFRSADLSNPPPLNQRFDVAQSLEVAEHIDATHAQRFVDFLTGLANVVVFSAALPFQGGTNHVNEQWPSYWQERFAKHDFQLYDVFRPRLWTEDGVDWWYAQNMFLYVKSGTHPSLAARLESQRGFVYPERIVHPHRVDPRHNLPPGVKSQVRALSRALAHRLRLMTAMAAMAVMAVMAAMAAGMMS